jgi:DNA-directed RNA polymerase subunit omega
MMLYPPMSDLVDKVGSRYLLVNLVARRAREIASLSEESENTPEKKPVSSAIDEVYTGKLTAVPRLEEQDGDGSFIVY